MSRRSRLLSWTAVTAALFAVLVSLFIYTQHDDNDSDAKVFPANAEATSPAAARTAREHLRLSHPSGEKKTVRMTVDGILRGQHYNSVKGTVDFLDDEGEVVDRVAFREVGLVEGRIETSTSVIDPSRRLDDISSVTLGPGLKLSQWRSKS